MNKQTIKYVISTLIGVLIGMIIQGLTSASVTDSEIQKQANTRVFNTLQDIQKQLNSTIEVKKRIYQENDVEIVEKIEEKQSKKQPEKKEVVIKFPTGYNNPDDLELIFLKGINIDYSQNQNRHFKRNGYIAFDIVDSSEDHAALYAPSYMYLNDEGIMQDEEREYFVETRISEGTMGFTIALKWDEGDREMEWNIGHVFDTHLKSGDKVKTGQKIGRQGGCKGSLQHDEKSTGCHVHVEIRQGGAPIYYPVGKSLHGEAFERVKLHNEFKQSAEKRISTGNYNDGSFDYNKVEYGNILQAIHSLENGQQIKNCKTSFKGARGCFQFMEGTWNSRACDGNNDGIAEPSNIDDSLCTASKFVDHLYKFYKAKHPNADEDHIVFKVLYSYNAGYALRDGRAIRKNNNVSPRADNGIPSAVSYGLRGLEMYQSFNSI